MKNTILLALVGFVGYSVAQSSCTALGTLVPSCASACISSAATALGCASDDYSCQCAPAVSNSIVIAALPCATSACGLITALAARASAGAVCKCITAATAVTSTTLVTTTSTLVSSSVISSSLTSTAIIPTTSSSIVESLTTRSTSVEVIISTTSTIVSDTSTSSSETDVITSPPTITATATCSADSPCAASVSAIPACGQPCLLSAGSAVGCASADLACQCSSSAVIQASAQLCVLGACAGTTAIDVLNAAGALCTCVSASPSTSCSSPSVTSSIVSTTSISTSSTSSVLSSTSTTSQVPGCTAGTGPDCSSVVATIPSCAKSCLDTSIASIGCGLTDYACQCTITNKALLTTDATPCILTSCESADIALTLSATDDVCACINSGPVGGTCTSTTSGASPPTKSVIPKTSNAIVTYSPSSTSCSAGTAPDCSSEAAAIPSCALSCLNTSIAKIGCDITDYACQCTLTNVALLTADVTPCVATSCPSSEIANVLSATNAVCSCANSGLVGGTCSTTTDSESGSGSRTSASVSVYKTTTASTPESTGVCVASTPTTPDCSAEVSAIPSCALTCLATSIAKIGCGIEGYTCQCTVAHKAALMVDVAPCVALACPVAEIPNVLSATDAVCICANTPVTGGTSCESGIGGSGSAVLSGIASSVTKSPASSSKIGSGTFAGAGGISTTLGAGGASTTGTGQGQGSPATTSTSPSGATTSATVQLTGQGGRIQVGGSILGLAVLVAAVL